MSVRRVVIKLKTDDSASSLVLPIRLASGDGRDLAHGVVSVARPADLRYESNGTAVFIRLSLPNGTTSTLSVLNGQAARAYDEITFDFTRGKYLDWDTWSSVRLETGLVPGQLIEQPGMPKAWFQLWEREKEAPHWTQVAIPRNSSRKSEGAIELYFKHSDASRALVVSLDDNVPQVVALPKIRTTVLVTTIRTLSGTSIPNILVGGYGANTEAMLEFLRSSTLNSVDAMLDPGGELAHELLRDKFNDPYSATAAAYYLLRRRDWKRLPRQWLRNLVREFGEHIPDTQLIDAISRIEQGMSIAQAGDLAVSVLEDFSGKRIPLFAEARILLADLLSAAIRSPAGEYVDFKRLQSVLRAYRPAGLSFGYTGHTPGRPQQEQRVIQTTDAILIEQTLSSTQAIAFDNVFNSSDQHPSPIMLITKPSQDGDVYSTLNGPGRRRVENTVFLRDLFKV